MVSRMRSSVRSSYNQDGAVVLDIRSNRIFNFNLVGSELLRILNSGATSDTALSRAIVERFGVEPEAAAHDVLEFLQQMKAYGLIEST